VTDSFTLWPTCWDCDLPLDVVEVGASRRCETTTTARCASCGTPYALNVRMAPLGDRAPS